MQIDTEEIPESILTGTMIQNPEKGLKNTGTVIDLSGCSLDSVLYEVSAQRPVIAKTGADSSVVIVGYDEYNTYLYDPVKKETYPYGMNDSTGSFPESRKCIYHLYRKRKLLMNKHNWQDKSRTEYTAVRSKNCKNASLHFTDI